MTNVVENNDGSQTLERVQQPKPLYSIQANAQHLRLISWGEILLMFNQAV